MNDIAYDDDFYSWTQQQARRLREAAAARANLPLDWENLAEEIESLGKSEKRAISSLLRQIAIHLLKLEYSPDSNPRPHWRGELITFRDDLGKLIADNPGLKPQLDVLAKEACEVALCALSARHGGEVWTDFPDRAGYSLDQLYSADWYPENVHDLT